MRTHLKALRIMKQGNNNSNPRTCSCVSLQFRLLSLPKSLFSDSRRTLVMSIIVFIALVASFSLKNLPISEKMFVSLWLGIGLSILFVSTSKLLIFRDIRKSLCSFLRSYFNLFWTCGTWINLLILNYLLSHAAKFYTKQGKNQFIDEIVDFILQNNVKNILFN